MPDSELVRGLEAVLHEAGALARTVAARPYRHWTKGEDRSPVSEAAVLDSLRRMAAKVDEQNAGDPSYIALSGNEDGPAFRAARDLVFGGVDQPNGYTEPLLHQWRARAKAGE